MLKCEDFNAGRDLDEQRALYRDCFPEAHVAHGATREHYDWKFRGMKTSPSAYEYAAFEDGKMLGYYAALPYPYAIGNADTVCGMVCDVMTHSQARGKGVFTSLGRYSLGRLTDSGIGFVSGYPIRPEVVPGHLKVGWKVAFSLPLHIKVLKTNAALKSKGLRLLAPATNLAASSYRFAVRRLGALRSTRNARTKVMTLDGLLNSEAYPKFFQKWARDRKNYLKKNRDFLKWRFSAPGAEYHAITVWQGGELDGVVFVRKTDFDKIPCLALLDFMCLDHRSSRTSLHRAVESFALSQDCEVVAGMMTRHTARKLEMLRHGFLRGKTGFQLILNRLDATLSQDDLFDEKNWDLMWIDSDDL